MFKKLFCLKILIIKFSAFELLYVFSLPGAGEFDDLISALRTGDVFGEDMAKMAKRNNRRRINNGGDMSREREGKAVYSWECPEWGPGRWNSHLQMFLWKFTQHNIYGGICKDADSVRLSNGIVGRVRKADQ